MSSDQTAIVVEHSRAALHQSSDSRDWQRSLAFDREAPLADGNLPNAHIFTNALADRNLTTLNREVF